MQITGIDVSKHQGKIDWKKVKSSGKVGFAILRAGYGQVASQKDSQFENNYSGCIQNNIPVGVYWYSYATSTAAAKKEAEVCLQILNGRELDYPVYYDIEEDSQISKGRNAVTEMARVFCETIAAAGYTPGLYSMKSGLEAALTEDIRNKYTVWVAQINVSKTTYKGKYDMWQYSWKGRVNGITGDVDMDYCYKDFTNNTPTPTPEPETPKKSVTEIAQEVIAGKWGNGSDRKKRLTEAGYDYNAVQAEVNRLLKPATPVQRTYTVKKGDTLSAIAKKYNTTVKKIVVDNKSKYPQITPNFIKGGWVLKV